MKRQIFLCLALSIVSVALLHAQDYEYIISQLQETRENGTVVATNALAGRMIIKADNSYTLFAESNDSGTWTLQKGQNGEPDKLMFASNSGQSYFAYVSGNTLMIWLTKTEKGTHLWAKADLQVSQTQSSPDAQLSVNNSGHFTRGLMYGGTNALGYQYADPSTGQQVGSDSVGFAFSPDGTFAMRNQSGQNVTSASGRYSVSGNQIVCKFDQGGDDILFRITNGGTTIQWITSGEVLTEYQFLGYMN